MNKYQLTYIYENYLNSDYPFISINAVLFCILTVANYLSFLWFEAKICAENFLIVSAKYSPV